MKIRERDREPSAFEVVWDVVRRIPRGRVATYGQISQAIDRRLTPVGVGWAIHAAKEGTIPWQRVVNASGGVSTDREHPGLQRAMLEKEGIRFGEEGRIDLARYQWRSRASDGASEGVRAKRPRRPSPSKEAAARRHRAGRP